MAERGRRQKEDTVGGGRVTCKSTESLLQLTVMMLTMSVAGGMTPAGASVLGVVWLVTLWTGPKPSPTLTAISLCCMCGPCHIQTLLHKATVLLEITPSLWKHPTLFTWPLNTAVPDQNLDSDVKPLLPNLPVHSDNCYYFFKAIALLSFKKKYT